MIPPTLRDLLRPREEAHFFDTAFIRLKGGKSVYVEKRVRNARPETVSHIGKFYVCLNKVHTDRGIAATDDRQEHRGLDEFEAQAVLDHYVETYGLLGEVTP